MQNWSFLFWLEDKKTIWYSQETKQQHFMWLQYPQVQMKRIRCGFAPGRRTLKCQNVQHMSERKEKLADIYNSLLERSLKVWILPFRVQSHTEFNRQTDRIKVKLLYSKTKEVKWEGCTELQKVRARNAALASQLSVWGTLWMMEHDSSYLSVSEWKVVCWDTYFKTAFRTSSTVF